MVVVCVLLQFACGAQRTNFELLFSPYHRLWDSKELTSLSLSEEQIFLLLSPLLGQPNIILFGYNSEGRKFRSRYWQGQSLLSPPHSMCTHGFVCRYPVQPCSWCPSLHKDTSLCDLGLALRFSFDLLTLIYNLIGG